MKIKTITCHDVYNVGASLQAYALAAYLRQMGHDVEIINYKPVYLSNHHSLWKIENSKYDKPILKEAYLIAKLPGRLKAKYGKRKKNYDAFTKNMLPLTAKRYTSNDELKADLPEADVYFAGSDQIWNTFFKNGKDPAFYLDFVSKGYVKASYAASFATEAIEPNWKPQIKDWIAGLDFVSVRESSGVKIIRDLGISGAVQVLDPVFLLSEAQWEQMERKIDRLQPYLLVYDFDQNPAIAEYAKQMAKKNEWKIYSILSCNNCDRCFSEEGPQAFIYLVHHAEFVVSNSFHATAFSLIFHKEFVTFNRKEKINTRMRDLTQLTGIADRVISDCPNCKLDKIDYREVQEKLDTAIVQSKEYINRVLRTEK